MSARKQGREIDLTDTESDAILRAAEKVSERDYLILALAGQGRGIRIGELVGVKKTTKYHTFLDPANHDKGGTWKESCTELPGIFAGDVREGAVWVRRKGGQVRRVRLASWLYTRLEKWAEAHPGKLFDVRERQAYNIVQKYAREAGLSDWQLVHPHRLRHYFITRVHRKYHDLPTSRDLAGHKSERTTLRYIARLTPEEEAQKLEEL